jgi:predicted DNA-binding transcriptional regulator AlpA
MLSPRESAQEVGLSLPGFWKAVAEGRLPLPVYPLRRAPRWRRSELHTALEMHRMLPADAKLARRSNRHDLTEPTIPSYVLDAPAEPAPPTEHATPRNRRWPPSIPRTAADARNERGKGPK